jgi:hypothetical protein
MKLKNLTGEKFGSLKVVKRAENINGRVAWVCLCDCGNYKTLRGGDLTTGAIKRCGHEKGKVGYIFEEETVIIKTPSENKFIIDRDDYVKIKEYNWTETGKGYLTASQKGKIIYLHRYIMDVIDGKEVDHINHNTYDNRKSNLRICNRNENARNLKIYSTNKSGVTGVFLRNGKWIAEIKLNQKKIYLGRFSNFKDAVKARYEAELKYFGEFRNSNNDDYIFKILNNET